jgi:pyrophosphate--fructose-6-phosphate 1-phosphotransferase
MGAMVTTVALLTAGGFAPCLSSAIGGLIERYTELAPDVEIIAYRYGYQGLLRGDSIRVTPAVRENAAVLHTFGGSPVGNSRVKLTNAADLVKRGLVAEGVDPLQAAADRLTADGVDVLHTIGGDDTNTTAADLAAYLSEHGHDLTVVGLPKTIDNDVIPIRQSLGAWTAAEQGARFAENIIGEHNSGSRMLIVHEVMGRSCGWLTAATSSGFCSEQVSRLRQPQPIQPSSLSRSRSSRWICSLIRGRQFSDSRAQSDLLGVRPPGSVARAAVISSRVRPTRWAARMNATRRSVLRS